MAATPTPASVAKNYSYKEFRLRLIPGIQEPSTAPEFIDIAYSPYKGTTQCKSPSASTITMNSRISTKDCLLAEEISSTGVFWTLKFLHIATTNLPMNLIQVDAYKKIKKLEIYCKVNINWLFCEVLSKLPRLEFLKLVFDNQVQVQKFEPAAGQGMECPTIRHLHLRTTPIPKGDNTQLIQNMNLVLYYVSLYLKKLTQVDFKLPIGTKLDEFLVKFPKILDAGNLNINFKHQLAVFSTYPSASASQQQQAPNHSASAAQSSTSSSNNKKDKSKTSERRPSVASTSNTRSPPSPISPEMVVISSDSDSEPDTTTGNSINMPSSSSSSNRIRRYSGVLPESPRCAAALQSPSPPQPSPLPSSSSYANETKPSKAELASLMPTKRAKVDYTNFDALYTRKKPPK